MVKKQKKTKYPIRVILDNIRSALNVGAIFRTCDATNIEKLMLCGITAYPPHNKIPKTALGATESVPWEHFESVKEAIKLLRNPNHITIQPYSHVVSVELIRNATSLWDFKFQPNTALIFGNEITGVSKEVLDMSDDVVKIPMFGEKKSLNVATSCGIVLYEVLRQTSL
jgi:23S rRNA (guanosine2251-2'-O)-methyltransferase